MEYEAGTRLIFWAVAPGRFWYTLHFQHLNFFQKLLKKSSNNCALLSAWNCWRSCIGIISGECVRSALFLSSYWVWHFVNWVDFFTSFLGVHLPWAHCDHANLVLFSRMVFPCGKIWWGWKGEWSRCHPVVQEPSLCLTTSESPLAVTKEHKGRGIDENWSLKSLGHTI